MGDFFAFPGAAGVTWIDAMFAASEAALYGVLADVAGQVEAAFGGLGAMLGSLETALKNFFAALWNWLQNVVEWILHTLLPAIQAAINKIRTFLQNLLAPIVKWIQWEKAWLDNIYNQLIKPLMVFIQRLRSILIVFRLLGFKWASTLDTYLANLESRINNAFLKVRQDVNTLANWIDYIVDPTGLFRVYPFILSAINSASQLWAVVTNAPAIIVSAAEQQAQAAAAASGKKSNATTDIDGRIDGPTAADQARFNQIVAIYQGDGYTIAT